MLTAIMLNAFVACSKKNNDEVVNRTVYSTSVTTTTNLTHTAPTEIFPLVNVGLTNAIKDVSDVTVSRPRADNFFILNNDDIAYAITNTYLSHQYIITINFGDFYNG
jgi:hypothetical protein